MLRERILKVLESYDLDRIKIATLGSHSDLKRYVYAERERESFTKTSELQMR